MNYCKLCGKPLTLTPEYDYCMECQGRIMREATMPQNSFATKVITHEEARNTMMKIESNDAYYGELQEELKLMATYISQQEVKQEPLVNYAKHLAKMFGQYSIWQYSGKNGADSENEKGYWRGMADSVEAFLQDLKNVGLIEHTGLHGDIWPADTNEIRYVEISDIDVTFGLRPNDDIYTANIPELLTVAIPLPTNFDQLSNTTKLEYFNSTVLKPIVLETLQDSIEFDTPDDPEFEVSDVDFEYLLKSKV